jgi:hypothetical protein
VHAVASVELGEQVSHMSPGGVGTYPKLAAYFSVRQPVAEEGENLAFAFGDSGEGLVLLYVRWGDFRSIEKRFNKSSGDLRADQRVAGRNNADRGDKFGRRCVFGQKSAGPGPQRSAA